MIKTFDKRTAVANIKNLLKNKNNSHKEALLIAKKLIDLEHDTDSLIFGFNSIVSAKDAINICNSTIKADIAFDESGMPSLNAVNGLGLISKHPNDNYFYVDMNENIHLVEPKNVARFGKEVLKII